MKPGQTYDPTKPALYVRRDGSLEWRESVQNAKMMYWDRQNYIISGPGDFDHLPIDTIIALLKRFKAVSHDELWHKCRLEVLFAAPGTEKHGSPPAFTPEIIERSTVRTRRHGLRVNAEKLLAYRGPKQAMHLAAWIADQHDGKIMDDDMLERSLLRMQRINPMKTRQSEWLVFRYYRNELIRSGGLTEA